VGARLALRIGGKIGPLSGKPLDLQCTVKALQRDLVMTGLGGAPTAMGDCALVEAEGVEIVLCTLRNQAMDTDVFTQLGCELASKAVVVVKSAQHFHASFAKIASRVIYVGRARRGHAAYAHPSLYQDPAPALAARRRGHPGADVPLNP
jgi:microcystin degradation protein MlrC